MSKKKKNTEIVAFTPSESARVGEAIVAESTEHPEEFGKKLMEIASSRNEKLFMETVVARAQELASHRNNLLIALEKTQREISLFDKRIAAVKAGEFKLSSDGRIIYNDVLLQY